MMRRKKRKKSDLAKKKAVHARGGGKKVGKISFEKAKNFASCLGKEGKASVWRGEKETTKEEKKKRGEGEKVAPIGQPNPKKRKEGSGLRTVEERRGDSPY